MITDFLAPVPDSILSDFENCHPEQIGSSILAHREIEGLPNLQSIKVAIVGVMEDRGAYQNQGCAAGADAIRRYLYTLYQGRWAGGIADLGNIYRGETIEDSHVALKEIIAEMLRRNIVTIILGGSQDLTYAAYRAYDALEQSVNLTAIDSRFDLGENGKSLNSKNYLSHIVLNQPYNLYNFANIGYQTYFVNQEELNLMERMYFDIVRLGEVRGQIDETEPYLRNADLVSIDIHAIRQTDAPGGSLWSSPHGLSGEEGCALSRYAGLSDKCSCFGIFEYNPDNDKDGQTAHLGAHMVWYFLEGYFNRMQDYPFTSKKEYTLFRVLIEDGDHELVFYKSPKSGRWWVEVPIQTKENKRHTLVPCAHQDYLRATKGEIPMRWWKALQKGM